MGQLSWVLIDHDKLQHIENDKEFGKKLSEAVASPRRTNQTVSIFAGGTNVGVVVGNYFHNRSIQIAVAEGFTTSWLANYQGPQPHSQLNKKDEVRMLFGRPELKKKKTS